MDQGTIILAETDEIPFGSGSHTWSQPLEEIDSYFPSPHKRTSLATMAGRIAATVSIGIYVWSLTLGGYATERGPGRIDWAPCFLLLLIGWLGVFEGLFAWLANPFALIAWILLFAKAPRSATIFALSGLASALSFLLCREILVNEAGHTKPILAIGLGYWLWVLSLFVAFVGGLIMWIASRREARPS